MSYQSMWGMHFLWWLFWVTVVAALLWRPWTSDSGSGNGQESPQDILRRRLASGEITPEDYENRMALLSRDTRDIGSREKGV